MSNKKKIVIVISIISIMILCFSISSFAVVYPNGMELHDGDVIILKDKIQTYAENAYAWNLSFNAQGLGYNYNSITFGQSRSLVYSTGTAHSSGGTRSTVYLESWNNNSNKNIVIRGDQTITDEIFYNWLYENTVSGIPEPPTPPHLEPSFWETVSGFFSEALASGTAIVNWMTITPIALIPLALYCLIVIIAITKRMIKG